MEVGHVAVHGLLDIYVGPIRTLSGNPLPSGVLQLQARISLRWVGNVLLRMGFLLLIFVWVNVDTLIRLYVE
ncbi:hypothetical protein J5N97_020792 [Dioscorea zingiberensis]|uniref:Uncharacterized protein n=1 Tax=Dioscorea zingiberensis TaxID=325984 RepID=A0A9D5CHW9_9LILI|nr:hypothetical protein J5N97_020792 [Dioscorea zingiberensis]